MRTHAAALHNDCEARPNSPEAGVAHRAAGITCWFAGEYPEARDHLERALAMFQPGRDDELAFRLGVDPGTAAMAYLAITSWPLGEVDRARSLIERMQTRISRLRGRTASGARRTADQARPLGHRIRRGSAQTRRRSRSNAANAQLRPTRRALARQTLPIDQPKRLIFNLPPGHMKSLIISVVFSAWLLGVEPSRRILCIRAVSERTESAGFPRVLEAFAEILKSSPANMIQLDRSPL